MKTLMIIETSHGGMLFSLAYLFAFAFAAVIMIRRGIIRGYPPGNWLLILFTGVVFFIIGDKVFTYSASQWFTIITRFHFPEATEKNALGGILGMLAGIALARIILGFKRPVFDNLAVALPLALAISRVGCFFAGCCFGVPASFGPAVQYDAASLACHTHLAQGLIDIQNPGSLPVHPVQLYQAIGCLVIAVIVWVSRNRWKANGSLFLFSALSYGFMRFFIEFLVDPASNSFAGTLLWGMNLVQWAVVLAFIPGIIALIVRERRQNSAIAAPYGEKGSEFRQVIMVVFLSVIVISGRHWFDPIEFLTMLLFFIPAIVPVCIVVYRNHTVAGFRWVLPAILLCSIGLMSQKSIQKGTEDEVIVFTTGGLTGMFGSYVENVSMVDKYYVGGGCAKSTAGYYVTKLQDVGPSKMNFWQTGLEMSYNRWTGKYNKLSVGGRIFLGEESGDNTMDYPRSLAIGISPYVNFNWQYFGIGTGFVLGQMKLPIGHKSEDYYDKFNDGDLVTTDYSNFYFMPALNFRIGPADVLYVEGAFPGMFPSPAPFPLFKIGLGSGLGKTNGTRVAFGYCQGIYAQLDLPIRNTVVLEAMYADNIQRGNSSKRTFSFGIHYRFFK